MPEQPTENSRYATLGDQVFVVHALTALIQMFPGLPSVYLTAHAHAPAEIWAQPDTTDGLEAWRTALQVPPSEVALHRYAGYCSIEFNGFVCGVKFKVFASTDLVPDRAARTPLEDAAFQAAMLVQRHELEDPAEPPLPGAQPVEQVEVRTLADMPGGAA